MRNFLNRISRGGNCVCVSIILGYVCSKKIHLFCVGSVRLCFGKLPQDPKRKFCGNEFCWDPPFKLRQLVLSQERRGTDDHEFPYGKLQAGNWTKQK